MSSNNKKGLTAFALLLIYKGNINKGVIMKTKEYYYEQECRDICEAIQDIDFGDQDFQPTMSEMVNKVMNVIGKPIFHTYDEIQDMIVDYCNEKGGN